MKKSQGFSVYNKDGQLINPIAKLDADGNIVQQYIYADKSNVPAYIIDQENHKYRLITDHLGSVRQVIDTETEEVVQEIEYDVWGNVISDSNPDFQPFYFAGGDL